MRPLPLLLYRRVCRCSSISLVCCSLTLICCGYMLLLRSTRVPRKTAAPMELAVAKLLQERDEFPTDKDINWMKNRELIMDKLTPLGKWLLSDEDTPPPQSTTTNRSFLILVWEHGPFLERRHIRRFSPNKKFSAWDGCSVSNCQLTYSSKDLDTADAVIFHLHRTASAKSLPQRTNASQRWIFLSDEAPFNTFLHRGQNLSDYNGLFNWSMTYRMDSDVPVPYGRTIVRNRDSTNAVAIVTNKFPARRDILPSKSLLLVVLGSNCSGNNNRWQYIKALKRVLGEELQILGRCLEGNRTACPGHFDADCPTLERAAFYLAFENSNCREYLSEKVFWNAYEKRAVPVVMGAPRRDCEHLLPPGSFLHVADFATPYALASYLSYLARQPDDYEALHAWRSRYRLINEHGYFASASKHYCRVCEALNYNSPEPKQYEDLLSFWDVRRDCSSENL